MATCEISEELLIILDFDWVSNEKGALELPDGKINSYDWLKVDSEPARRRRRQRRQRRRCPFSSSSFFPPFPAKSIAGVSLPMEFGAPEFDVAF